MPVAPDTELIASFNAVKFEILVIVALTVDAVSLLPLSVKEIVVALDIAVILAFVIAVAVIPVVPELKLNDCATSLASAPPSTFISADPKDPFTV